MISRQDIQRLLHHHGAGAHPVLSVFLDMSVDSDNKRTYDVFLDRFRRQHTELRSDRASHHREPLGEAFSRVRRWIDEEFDPAHMGVAIYAEIGGDWLEGLQIPVPVPNRATIADQPVIGPLAQVVETARRHGVIVVDRERLRMVDVILDTPVIEHTVETEPYPAPHDVQAGGEAAKGYQKRKAEEVKHFFREFALEVAEFDRRYRPDDLVLLGTRDNVIHFLDFLPEGVRQKVVHIDHAPVVPESAEVIERLAPFFRQQVDAAEAATIRLVHDRVAQGHLAAAGFQDTLERLQEGKAEALVLSHGAEHTGARCLRCGFYHADLDADCPYCGGQVEPGVDLVEAMIRMAEEQEIDLHFVDPAAMTDLHGVGALLKF